MTATAINTEAITHRAYSPSTLTISPGAHIDLHDFEWALREVAILVAGPTSDKLMGAYTTLEALAARHESSHLLLEFMTGARMRGASIIPYGDSLGRTSTRIPPPGSKSLSDEERIESYVSLSGGLFDLAEIEAFTTQLLVDFQPLVRRLASALLERKVLSARRCRQILFTAFRKDWRRARVLAERDRRAQRAFGLEFRKAIRA